MPIYGTTLGVKEGGDTRVIKAGLAHEAAQAWKERNPQDCVKVIYFDEIGRKKQRKVTHDNTSKQPF